MALEVAWLWLSGAVVGVDALPAQVASQRVCDGAKWAATYQAFGVSSSAHQAAVGLEGVT